MSVNRSASTSRSTAGAVSRRSLLLGAVTTAGAVATSGTASAHPAPVGLTADTRSEGRAARLPAEVSRLLDAWSEAPGAHPLLGDWRRAGYRRGTARPRAAGRVTLARRLGITPGSHDSSRAIQEALENLGRTGGGVLQLDAGRYTLRSPLFVHDSNVALRGRGVNETTLYFPRTLEDTIGSTRDSTGQSSWSWTGGQVFFISRERLAASRASGWAAQDGKGTEGWLAGERLADVAPAVRGTDVLLVDDSSALTPGAMVLLEVDNLTDRRLLREVAGDIPGAQSYDWAKRAHQIAAPVVGDDFATWRWPVVVTEVLSPRTVRIEQPLRLSIHPETPARILELGPTVHDSGIEDLTIENKVITQTAHNQNPGSNGVCFQAVHDCWAKNVRVLNADLAFGMTCAKSCTLSGITYEGRALHHFVACRVLSHDNLVEDFVLNEFTVPAVAGSYQHGINLEGLSSGNVYRRGTLHTGTFDSHRQLPFENLRTDISVTNKDSVPGGAVDAGPYFGARTVHWGVHVTNGNNLGMEITDIAPRSISAGITGLAQPGSILGSRLPDYKGDLQSENIAFGVDLGRAADLLDLQRLIAPAGVARPAEERA